MRIECTEGVVVNNIIGVYKAAANHRKIGCTFCAAHRDLLVKHDTMSNSLLKEGML